MPVNLAEPRPEDLYAVAGVRLGVAEAGVRKTNRKDVMLMLLDPGAQAAGVFTKNRFCAAPVQVCREHLVKSAGKLRAIVVNTGVANAGTGEQGMTAARQTCVALAGQLGVDANLVLPFSTGVIMEQLPVERIVRALPVAQQAAMEQGWAQAAKAIMTTDTLSKACSRRVHIGDSVVTISGMAKGAGMIRPNMATMLGFVATDARIAPQLMQALVSQLADESFNAITVDGDTSTNDSFVLVATNQAKHPEIDRVTTPEFAQLYAGLREVSQALAHAIVRDAEGATKFITVRVEGGGTVDECRKVAYAIGHSPLVKTAFFASDPNLGRILAAVGYAGIDDLDASLIDLHLDDVHVATRGGRHPSYQEADGARVMAQSEILVRVGLGRGDAVATIWTCDFSHEYVSINADYRS